MRKGNQQIARILKWDLRHEVKICVNSNYCWMTKVDLMDEWSDSWAVFLWCKGEKVLIAWTFCRDFLKMGQQPGGKCNYQHTSASLQASTSILPQLNPVSVVWMTESTATPLPSHWRWDEMPLQHKVPPFTFPSFLSDFWFSHFAGAHLHFWGKRINSFTPKIISQIKISTQFIWQ